MIKILFRVRGIICIVEGFPQDKFSVLVEKYKNKSGDYDWPENFIYGGKTLRLDLSIEEQGLTHLSCLDVIKLNDLPGGGGFSAKFTDVSKMKTINLPCSYDAPSYRKAGKGINIFGICYCKNCIAYKKEVIVPISSNKFDFIKEKDAIFCPKCESIIVAKTVGFYMCKYKIYGRKYENGSIMPFENSIDESKDVNTLKYFDPDKNGESMFVELTFEILSYY